METLPLALASNFSQLLVVEAEHLATMPLLLVLAVLVAGFPLRGIPERLQRLLAVGLAHLQPLTADVGRTRWRRLEPLFALNTVAVLAVVTRTYLPMVLAAALCWVVVAVGSVEARRSHLQRSTLRLEVLRLSQVVQVVRREHRARLPRTERLAQLAE